MRSLKPIRTGFLFYSTLFDFFGHILLCTNWNRNREPGNGDFGTVEPGNDFSGSGNLPIYEGSFGGCFARLVEVAVNMKAGFNVVFDGLKKSRK